MLTEVEKIRHLTQKYHAAKRLYTVYQRSGEAGRFVFTLIYGTDNKHKAIAYVRVKEEQGLFLVAYCARPQEKSSRCVYVSGLRNSLHNPSSAMATDALASPAASSPSHPSLTSPAASANGLNPSPSGVRPGGSGDAVAGSGATGVSEAPQAPGGGR